MVTARWMSGLFALWLGASVGCEDAAAPASDKASAAAGEGAEKVERAEPDAPIEPGVHAPKRPADQPLEQAPDPAKAPNLVAAMSRLAQRYASDWVAASEAFEARLEQGASQEYQLVLGSVNCYRVLGVGEASLEDVDLLLFDPNGVQVQQDEGSDRFPVLGLSYPVCPPVPGAYRLEARAVKGEGRLRVQAFHTP